MITAINEYKIISKVCISPWWKKALNWIIRRKNEYLFEVELTLAANVGYLPKNLLTLNTNDKVLVISSKQNIVLVRTIKPVKELKGLQRVQLLSRKWGGSI